MTDQAPTEGRALRADAQRNRQRVLDVAAEAFATDGLGVPVHEIARRAGVGTGTVSRHFPAKDDLFRAIVLDRVARIVARARDLARAEDAGAAFFEYFAYMVEQGAVNRGLAEAFAGAGYDMESAAADAGYDLRGALADLLDRAQRAGAVDPDLDDADVKALIVGCLARERQPPDPAARRRVIAVVRAGMRRH